MKKLIIGLLFTGVSCFPFFTNAQANQAVADEIIKIVKAQWAAEIADPTNVAEHLKTLADDYTEFNGDYATRLEGKALITRLSEAGSKDPGRGLASEMLNPKVQVYGDVAILSYNYAGISKNKDGVTKPGRAKSTRVYAKIGGSWKLVHANFAPDPLPHD